MGRFGVLERMKRVGRMHYRSAGKIGYQDAGFKRYILSDLYRDKFSQCEWRGTGSGNPLYGVSADGLGGNMDHTGTVNEIRAGDSAVLLYLKRYWASPGDYEVTYPSGMGCALNNPGTKTLSSEHPTGTPGIVARTLHIAENNDGQDSWLSFTVGTATLPLGLRPTIIKVGDTHTDWIASQEDVDSYRALGANCLRTMDQRFINSDMTNYDWPRIYQTQGPSIPYFVDLCNRAGMDLWLNMSFYMTDAAMLAEFLYIAQHLNPNLNLYIEWSNEVWNFQFGQAEESCIQGVLKGFHLVTTSAAATPLAEPTYRAKTSFGKVSGVNGVPLVNITTGDTLIGNISGVGVVHATARQNMAANDTAAAVPAATNSYWTINVTASISNKGSNRYMSWRVAAIDGLAKTSFTSAGAATSRVRTVIAGQSSDSILTGSIRDAFEFDSNYLIVKHHAVAPYYGGNQANFKLGDYAAGSHTEHGPWTFAARSAFIANYPTDPTGALATLVDIYFDPAVATAAVDGTCAVFETRASDLVTYNTTQKGRAADAITPVCYEFGPHNNIQDGAWPNSTAWNALQQAIQNDPRQATLYNRYVPRIRAAAIGPICWYARFGNLPWNTMDNELDRTSLNFVTMAALAA